MAETTRKLRAIDLPTPNKWSHREASPERIKIWRKEPVKDTETGSSKVSLRSVQVLYYLSFNGQLQHPHFIDVPVPSSQGLYLKDFIHRLDQLRGNGMASFYSWSSKRRYKNGFVWQDLSEDDLIHPSHGNEYVLKGSELLDPSPPQSLCSQYRTVPFSNPRSVITSPSPTHSNLREIARRRNQSLSSIDLHKYVVYRSEMNMTGESTPPRAAADASTQTGDWRRLRRSHASTPVVEEDYEMQQELKLQAEDGRELERSQVQSRTELSKEDISPPPSDSSPETLESLRMSDRPLMLCRSGGREGGAGMAGGGRLRASSFLMQLISCGSLPFKYCGGPSYSKDRGGSIMGDSEAGNHAPAGAKLEKEYLSGRGREVMGPSLKRWASSSTSSSSSHNNTRR